MIVILDNIRSSHNVGSIFRTAECLGIKKIILAGITPYPVDRFSFENKKLTKVSLGAEKSIDWQKTPSTKKIISKYKKIDYQIIALEQHKNSKNLVNFKSENINLKKSILIIGEEVNGISSDVLALCDEIIEIPMKGKKESLNVSIAFAIAIYHLMLCPPN